MKRRRNMKRRLLWLVVCVAMVTSLLAMPVSALASTQYLRTIGKVNLRDPSNLDHVIKVLKKNTKVIYNGKMKKNMCLVQTEKGDVGYVFKLFLDSASTKSKSFVRRARTKVTVYKSADTSSRKVCSLDPGDYVKVEYSGTLNGMYFVTTTKNKKGYIPKGYLTDHYN